MRQKLSGAIGFAIMCGIFAACTLTIPKLILRGHVQFSDGGAYVATIESAEPLDADVSDGSASDVAVDAALDTGSRDASPDASVAVDSGIKDASIDAGVDSGASDGSVLALGVGTNLGEPYDYQGERAYLNDFDQSRGWQTWGNYEQNRCCEERILKWEGTGTISISNVQSWRSVGTNRIVYVAKPEIPDGALDQQSVFLKLTGTVTNVVDVELRYEGLNQLFHPLFLERLGPFKVLRFMDWGNTNDSPQTTWVTRPQPFVGGVRRSPRVQGGVPYEDMIDLANATGKTPWFTVPHQADDDYVRQFAILIRDRLRSDLKVIIEYSNETWNGQFSQASYVQQRGLALGLSANSYEAGRLYNARRSVEIWSIMRSVLGDRVVRVMAGQLGDDSAWSTGVMLNAARGSVDAFALGTYFYAMSDASVDQTLGWVRTHRAKAAEYGVPLISYEGGMHMIPGTADARNPAIYDRYLRLLRGWRVAGGALFVHFTNAYQPGGYGSWGALEYTEQPLDQAHKYRALRDVASEWGR